MFKVVSGGYHDQYFPKKASTAFDVGDAVYPDGSGAIQPADATSGEHMGLCAKKVTSSDSDYAETTKILVHVLHDDTIVEADVVTGTATAALIGTYIDLADETGVDVTASAKDAFFVTDVISATKVRGYFNSMAANKDVATT
jgi:hypothetical protein